MNQAIITLVTVGTRGDVQPYVALGLGLKAAGYEVRIAAPAVLSGLITRYGLTALPIQSVDPQTFLGQAAVQDAAGRQTPLKQLVALLREARPMFEGYVEEVWQACQASDAVVAGTIFYGAQDSAEKLGIPCIYAFLHPILPTAVTPSPLFPRLPFNVGVVNRGTHRLVQQLLWQPFRPVINAFRRRLELAPQPLWGPYGALNDERSPVLFGFSPTVFPKPSDWPTHVHVTGYWFLNEPDDWVPPEGLQAFLERGATPVYIGFGSMMGPEVGRVTRLTLEALRVTGHRAVLASGVMGFGEEMPETVFQVKDVPHAWLFPKMAAVIHHGGAGTTGSVLRAGIPSIPIPLLGDQPFWAGRIAMLGAGLPANHRKLTVEALADRLRIVTSADMLERAARIGALVRAEKGVQSAVEFVQEHLARSKGGFEAFSLFKQKCYLSSWSSDIKKTASAASCSSCGREANSARKALSSWRSASVICSRCSRPVTKAFKLFRVDWS